MFRTEFKNQVDNLMNILFGAGVASHATIIEQINYLVFLRSISKKDDSVMILDSSAEKIFSGELAKYHWDNLLILNSEVLFTTLEEIFRKLPELATDQTIRLLFRDAHVKIFDKPTLRRLVHEIEKMMSELEKEASSGHTDIFGDMYEYLLSKQAQAGTLGQFRTPRHIIKFIVDIIDPSKGETILDPACGTAGFLVSALEHLKEKYTSDELKKEGRLVMDKLTKGERDFVYQQTFTGFDSDFDMFKFGLMNLYLHKLEHPNIKRQNTLVDTAGDRTKWDIILANPPFAGALDQDSVSEDLRMGTRATEVLFLKYIIDHLSKNGRAGVIVPEGVVFNSTTAHKKIRQTLVEDAGLWCVVSLPSGVFNPYAGVKTSILFLDRKISAQLDSILFVKIDNDGYDLGAQRKEITGSKLPIALTIINSYKRNIASKNLPQTDKLESLSGNTISIFVPKSKIGNLGEYYLTGERYKSINEKINQKYPTFKLEEILDRVSEQIDPKSETGEVFYVGLENIESNSGRVIEKPAKYEDIKSLKNTFKKGDLLYGKLRPNLNKVWLADRDGICSTDILVFRGKEKSIASFYKYLLLSEHFVNEVMMGIKGAQLPRVGFEYLKNMTLPLPSVETQKQITKELDGYQKIIDGATMVLNNYRPKVKFNDSWKLEKISDVAQINPPKPKLHEWDLDKDVDFIPMADLDEESTSINRVESRKIKDVIKGYTCFQSDDLLLAKITPCFENGKIGIYKKSPASIAFGSTEYIVIRANQMKVKPLWLWLFLYSEEFRNEGSMVMTGSAGQKRLPVSYVENYKIPVPSTELQDQVINQEIHIVGELVKDNRKLIEIYQQKIREKIESLWTAN